MDPSNARNKPAALRTAPVAASTPLPGSFLLTADTSTSAFDAGTVLLGGSPLRLFRITERARQLVAHWQSGHTVGEKRADRLLARRLVSAGAFSPHPSSAAFGPEDVTVVVPVRDRARQLDRLLGDLDGATCIVVDDASSDAGTTKEIAERHGARFIGLALNGGPSGARNAGFAAVHSPLVAFVDSDCRPTPGWLEPLLGHFDDPVVAAVAPRIVPASADAAGTLARYESVRSSLDRGDREGPVRQGGRITYVPSAALLVRVDVAAGPELFDPALRGGEDVDLVWRLGDAGWDVRYEPASTVGHDGPATIGDFLRRRGFYGATAAPLATRHGEAVAPLRLSGWSLAVWLLALARRPVLALATLGASIAILANRFRGLVREPFAVATRIAGVGTLRAAAPALGGFARAWSPALVFGLFFRRTRRASALALLAPAVTDWVHDRGVMDPVRYTALHVADDVAYGTGVWVGCLREGTTVPLVPVVSWRARVWSSGALRTGLAGSASAEPAEGDTRPAG